jgi:hypothetical protein
VAGPVGEVCSPEQSALKTYEAVAEVGGVHYTFDAVGCV